MLHKKIFFALTVGLLFVGAGCTKAPAESVSSPTPLPPVGEPTAAVVPEEPTGTLPVAPAPELPKETHRVDIKSFAFAEKELRVKVGDAVIWTNRDGVGHTVTADAGAFDSPLLEKDKTYSTVFTTPGTFTYFCKPHPSMKAAVIVE